jgi:hypothetical protein
VPSSACRQGIDQTLLLTVCNKAFAEDSLTDSDDDDEHERGPHEQPEGPNVVPSAGHPAFSFAVCRGLYRPRHPTARPPVLAAQGPVSTYYTESRGERPLRERSANR